MIIRLWMNAIASRLIGGFEAPEKPFRGMMITSEKMFVARLAVATALNAQG
jgi:hypothetical protein